MQTYSKLEPNGIYYKYEKVTNDYIICNISYATDTAFIDFLKERLMPHIQHAYFFCRYKWYANSLPKEDDTTWNNLTYTIHNIIYDDIEYTIDMAKQIVPIKPSIAFIEEPNIMTYKKPYYSTYLNYTFPSFEQYAEYTYDQYSVPTFLQQLVYPVSTYIPSKYFKKINWDNERQKRNSI